MAWRLHLPQLHLWELSVTSITPQPADKVPLLATGMSPALPTPYRTHAAERCQQRKTKPCLANSASLPLITEGAPKAELLLMAASAALHELPGTYASQAAFHAAFHAGKPARRTQRTPQGTARSIPRARRFHLIAPESFAPSKKQRPVPESYSKRTCDMSQKEPNPTSSISSPLRSLREPPWPGVSADWLH